MHPPIALNMPLDAVSSPLSSTAAAPIVGRLAPTPSGRLHLGNVCAFAAAWLSVRAQGGRLLLRVEDVDRPRADAAVEASLRADLDWLGLGWDAETPRQSERDYGPALEALRAHTYVCGCTRAEIQQAGRAYRGRCRDRGLADGAIRFRLPDIHDAVIIDRARGRHVTDLTAMGDPVLRRRDGVFAYNLAVVADDVADGVTEVVRGEDLLDQSAVQECIWRALGHAPPTWLHTPLIVDAGDRKLSKSHGSVHVGELREAGWTVADFWRRVLPWLGLEPVARIDDAAPQFRAERIQRGHIVVR
jgi:glutamyl/glutaminyl-tRNA synthetase